MRPGVCLFAFGAIALAGGSLQFVRGQPETTPQLDNVHRFMAGVYFSMGLVCLWTGVTVREQNALVYLIALGVFLAGCGRLLSIAKVGLPQPKAVWLGYLIPELVVPIVGAVAQYVSR